MAANPFRAIIIGLAIAASHAFVASAAEKPSARDSRHIADLIEALASSNLPLRGEEKPMNFDPAAQRRVIEAAKALCEAGADAFPQLAAMVDDRRHSCSFVAPNGYVNWNMGRMCREIIHERVDVYEAVIRSLEEDGPPGWFLPEFPRQDLRQWSKERVGLKLDQLQIEAAEHALKELKNYRTGRYAKWLPVKNYEQTRAEDIENVEQLIEKIRAGGKPVGAGPFHPEGYKAILK